MKKKDKPKKRIPKENTNLVDLGLEPPKLYRDSQKKIVAADSKQRKSKQLSRNEKRQKDTKRRKKRNKLRKFLLWFLAVVVIASVGVVLSLTAFFGIENITVSGNARYTEEEILNQCLIGTGENLFLADVKSASDMLELNLPYIYTAEIKRKLPSTIELVITESEPAYYIKNKDKTFILLDDNFKVLETDAEKSSGIAVKKAKVTEVSAGRQILFEDKDTGECLKKLSQAVKDNNIDEITAIYSNNISDNYVVYDNRIEFKLGTCDDLEQKIYQGLAACKQLNESNPNAKGIMTINGGKQIYFTEK